jgi:WD40 repeat protein
VPARRQRLALETAGGPLITLAFSPDGKTLAGGDQAGIMLWAIPSGKLRRSPGLPSGSVRAVTFAAGGRLLASGEERGAVRLWDARSWKERQALGRHAGPVYDAAATGGRLLATAGGDSTVRLWDTREGKQLAALRLGAPALSVAFSPDGRLLAAGDYRGGLTLWRVAGLRRARESGTR